MKLLQGLFFAKHVELDQLLKDALETKYHIKVLIRLV